ncbi:TonB family protein [Sphingomonas sp. DT-207]|uniref:energy transducer TonB n=1 Tax=Sphingomonas sp. DT-207 TaxID=3396167 RepID=UPI003F1B2644
MYAEHRYEPRQSRSASFGAAFLINGAVMAGIFFLIAPNIVSAVKDGPITLITPYDPPTPPPIDEPKPEPRAEPRTNMEPPVVAPTPVIRSDTTNPTTVTETIPPLPPSTNFAEKVGPTSFAEPTPLPLPPLVGASQDMRYLKDFQPPYPASELRAERDGVVRLKVLIGIDGRVKAVEQLSATSTAFFEAARRQALSKWRFKPATRGGVPEESWKTMSVRFEIASQ